MSQPELQEPKTPPPAQPPEQSSTPEEKVGTDAPESASLADKVIGFKQDNNSTARDITIVQNNQQIEKQVNEIKAWFIGEGATLATTLSVRMAEIVSTDIEADNAARHCIDPDVTQQLLTTLQSRRMLLLTAAPDSGKGATALWLAHQIKRKDEQVTSETLRVRALDADVRVDIAAFAADSDACGKRVLLFKDVLARNNRDLRAFFSTLDDVAQDRIGRILKENHTYLIFTADQHSLGELSPALLAGAVCHQLPALSRARLRQGLSRELERCRQDAKSGTNPELSDELIEEILTTGRSMPRVLRLVRDYFPQIRSGELRVAEAFHLLDDAKLRFQGDLTADFDSWYFTFVLALALVVNPADGVPWTEFEYLRRALVDVVRSRVGKSAEEPNYNKDRLSEDALLRKTLSTIERDPATGRDVLRFQDPADAERLWLCMLAHHRGLLCDVFPVLLALVGQTDQELLNIRVRAAQIIGRLGEIDPWAFTATALRTWGSSEIAQIRVAPGYLFEGAHLSRSRDYRERCLAELDRMSRANGKSEQGYNVLWSATAVCKRLGLWDLPLAVNKLRQIVELHLVGPIAGLRDMERRLGQIQSEFERTEKRSVSEAVVLVVANRLLREWSRDIYDKQAPLLFTVQYAVVALCITLDPVRVLAELRSWMRGDDSLRAVTVLIYLQAGGIAEEMHRYLVPVTAEDGKEILVSPVVAALVLDATGPKHLAEFLEDIFACFHVVFPPRVTHHLCSAFFGRLCGMAEQSAAYARGLTALEEVFFCLATSQIGTLKTQLLDVLDANELFHEGKPLWQFKRNFTRRMLTEHA